jgi:replicative DNA helicase
MIEEYRDLIFTPEQAAGAHLQWAEEIATTEGSMWGIPKVDRKVIPERPGEMTCIIGRPGHGKSSILAFRARGEAERIMEAQKEDKRKGHIVLYITFDDSVEEIENFFVQGFENINSTEVAWGRANLDSIRRRTINRSRLPIWLMGHSITRSAKYTGKMGIRMTPQVLFDAIEQLQDAYAKTAYPIEHVSMICVDYIQRMPVPGTRIRTEEVTEAVYRIKELGVRLGTRTVVAVQASRAVDNRDVKIPEVHDCQHASAIEQVASKMFSVWRPWRTELVGIPEDAIIEGPNGYKMLSADNRTIAQTKR